MTDEERDVPARQRALSAAILLALEEAESDSSDWRYRSDVETSAVVSRADGEVSPRTARRACRDAIALGWLEDRRGEGWDLGPVAEENAPDDSGEGEPDVYRCQDCRTTVLSHGMPGGECPECGEYSLTSEPAVSVE